MATTVADVKPKSLENAKRQFVELYGSSLVLNTYLKIALVLVCFLALGLLALNFRTQAQYANLKPLVIRIDDVGRAEAVAYDAAAYRPQAPELRYFLTRFVVTHFSRLRAAVQRDYPDSLFFLAPALAEATIAQNERSRSIETFLTSPSTDEIDVEVKNVTFAELATSPYKAAVDFDMRYFAPGTRQERRRETYVLQVDFILRDAVPNAFIRVNPLGLQITYFRIDQAFQ
ncbi:MAG: VirB8/TrbF family protein [Vicinamibacterales bacterium]